MSRLSRIVTSSYTDFQVREWQIHYSISRKHWHKWGIRDHLEYNLESGLHLLLCAGTVAFSQAAPTSPKLSTPRGPRGTETVLHQMIERITGWDLFLLICLGARSLVWVPRDNPEQGIIPAALNPLTIDDLIHCFRPRSHLSPRKSSTVMPRMRWVSSLT